MYATHPASLDSAALSRRLSELAGHEREVQVEFLLHLEEYDRRRAFLEEGYDSLWAYCQRALLLREGPASLRINAMRVLRRFPAVSPFDGRQPFPAVPCAQRLPRGGDVRARAHGAVPPARRGAPDG